MKINNKKQIIPESVFVGAFCKLFKCKPEELMLEITEENKSAGVVFREHPYRIKTRGALLEEVQYMLTDNNVAQLICLHIWIEVAKGALSNPQFYCNLIEVLGDCEEARIVNIALNISDRSSNRDEIFWRFIDRMHTTLFGNLVVAIARLFNFDELCQQVLDLQIHHGETVYNHYVGGMFDQVTISHDNGADVAFYIIHRIFKSKEPVDSRPFT